MRIAKVATSTYEIEVAGRTIGRVALVELAGIGRGWMAWTAQGEEIDAWEVTRAEAIGALVRATR